MSKVVLVHRTVSHFKKPFFEALAAQYGWHVVCASNLPQQKTGDYIAEDTPAWMTRVPFRFIRNNPYTCLVPIRKILRQHQPDVLILEAGSKMSSTWLCPFLWPVLRKLGLSVPALVLWGHGKPVGTPSKIAVILKKWLTRRADGYLTYTPDDAAYLQSLAPQTLVASFNNTIDIAPMLARRDDAMHTQTDAKHILMVGRMTADKKFDEAIRLMPRIWETCPKAQLTIIGGGTQLAELRQLAGEELGKRIHLPGALYSEDELAPYYNRAQFFWLMGAAGLGVNHALAYGLPVLAFSPDATGEYTSYHHPEIAYVINGQTGWLVEEGSSTAMLKKLQELLSLPSARTPLGEPLVVYAEENLNLNHSVQYAGQFIEKIEEAFTK